MPVFHIWRNSSNKEAMPFVADPNLDVDIQQKKKGQFIEMLKKPVFQKSWASHLVIKATTTIFPKILPLAVATEFHSSNESIISKTACV